jgi:polysaccharide pyruvyl transferase WcaK-like protein
VSLRDNASLELASSLGCLDATLGADLCFSESVRLEESERVSLIRSKAKNGYVIIALKGNDDKAKLKFIKSLQKLCDVRGWEPLFVAMDGSEDREPAKSLACLCGGIYAGDLTRGELLSLIASAEVAIGQRLHFLIFSLLVGKCFVGVGRSPKIVSFTSEALGMPTLDLSDPSSLSALVDKAMGFSSEELSSVLKKYQNSIKNELKELKKTFFV